MKNKIKDNDNIEQQIQKILRNFDFYKVSVIMQVLNWSWQDKGVPNKQELKNRAEWVLRGYVKDNSCRTSCGGFQVTDFLSENGNPVLELQFVLEEYDGEYV